MAKRATFREFPTQLILFLAAVVIALVIGWAIGRQGPQPAGLTNDSASSWVSAVATLAIAILTFVLAKETWELRKAQAAQLQELRRENLRPNINFQLESSKVGMNFADVKLANLGKGIARRITVGFLDRQGVEVQEGSNVVVDEFLKLAIFRKGIESMGIGQTISSYLINFPILVGKLEGQLSNGWIHMVIKYEDIEGTHYANEFVVDFSQFEGLSQLGGGDPLYLISQEVRKFRE